MTSQEHTPGKMPLLASAGSPRGARAGSAHGAVEYVRVDGTISDIL